MVTDGYKQTEIGILPIEWELKSYEDVFKFLTTATYSRAVLSDNGEIQYLHYGDIHTKYHFSLDFSKYQLPTITTEQVKKYPLLADGDIVMADASEDYAGICKSVELKGLENKKAIAGLHTFLLRDRNSVFVDGFRGYVSASSLLKKQFDRLATGMKVFGVSKNNLKMVQIPIPSKQEQKAIATALSSVDELIASLETLIAKKEDIKTATMQQLLTGKKRLDGFSGDWEEKKLEDISKVKMGHSPSSINYNTNGVGLPLIQGNADIKDRKTIIRNYTSQITRKSYANDIIMSVRAPVGEIARATFDSCIGRGVCAITIKNEFLYHYLVFIEPRWSAISTGSTFDSVTSDEVKSLLIYLPVDNKEQTAIATILSDMDKELEALKTRLEKTKAIKEGMMQELLTGKTRLLQEVS